MLCGEEYIAGKCGHDNESRRHGFHSWNNPVKRVAQNGSCCYSDREQEIEEQHHNRRRIKYVAAKWCELGHIERSGHPESGQSQNAVPGQTVFHTGFYQACGAGDTVEVQFELWIYRWS